MHQRQADALLLSLRQRYQATLGWFETVSKAKVAIRPHGIGNSFYLVAMWPGGEHRKLFDGRAAEQLGRIGCSKRLAENFVDEVLVARGLPPLYKED